MKTFRKPTFWGDYCYWARWERKCRKSLQLWRRFHKHATYGIYSTRPHMCGRAAWMQERNKILNERYPIRNFYGKKIYNNES